VRFIISKGLQLPKSLLTEFEELGNETRLDNEEENEEEDEVTSSSSSNLANENDQELLSTVTSTTGVSKGGKAQRVKVRDDESNSTRTRRTTRASTRKKNTDKTEMTHDDNEDEEEEEIKDSLPATENARYASQSLLALAEMRNLIAARELELASLRRKDAESSYLRLSMERQSQKLTDTVSELEAKLTRASLLHQRLMKALEDAEIQVLGSDTSFSIIQENEGGGGGGGVFNLENNRQAFGIGKLQSGSDNNEDEFVPASSVFSSSTSIFAPAPRRKEAAE